MLALVWLTEGVLPFVGGDKVANITTYENTTTENNNSTAPRNTNYTALAERHERDARDQSSDPSRNEPRGATMLLQGTPAAAPFFSPAFQGLTQPGSPPDIVAVSQIMARDLIMIGFWYRFAYGFRIFGEMNNVNERWVTASSAYFDMLANGYWMHLQTLMLYMGTMQMMAFKQTDQSTWPDAQLGLMSMRGAHFFYSWLFWQNSLDLLHLHEAHGNTVDPKLKQNILHAVSISNWWAFMHYDMTASFGLYRLHADGKPWDTSKLHAALSYVFQRQFAWMMKSLNWAHLPWIPEELPFKEQLKKSENFHGYALGGLSSAIVFHQAMAVHAP